MELKTLVLDEHLRGWNPQMDLSHRHFLFVFLNFLR